MRRISVLILTAMLLTISGVYATWNYAQGNTEVRTRYTTPALTDKVVGTAKGTITVDHESFKVSIDDANNDHIAEAVYEGSIKITFTPSQGADTTVVKNGIPIVYSFSVTNPWTYGEQQIFTVTSTGAQETQLAMTPVYDEQDDEKISHFEATIPAETIKTYLVLGNFSLPTSQEYEDFKAVLNNGSICITVKEMVSAPAQ